jgi:hypothetical protein
MGHYDSTPTQLNPVRSYKGEIMEENNKNKLRKYPEIKTLSPCCSSYTHLEVDPAFVQMLSDFDSVCFEPMNVERKGYTTTIFFQVDRRVFGVMWTFELPKYFKLPLYFLSNCTITSTNFEEGILFLVKGTPTEFQPSKEFRVVRINNHKATLTFNQRSEQ